MVLQHVLQLLHAFRVFIRFGRLSLQLALKLFDLSAVFLFEVLYNKAIIYGRRNRMFSILLIKIPLPAINDDLIRMEGMLAVRPQHIRLN